MYERRVNIQNLINLSKREGRIDEFELAAESERLYRSIKVIGLKETVVCYEENKKMKVCYANELSEHVRAIAAFIAALIYRWNDLNSGRLEIHFGLQIKIVYILGDIKIFKNNQAGLECISIKDFINAYMDK